VNAVAVPRELDVLVVEDEPDVRTTLSELIDSFGYRAAAASNGEEALRALEAERPRLVLLDLMMPVMDGWEFCRRVNEDAALRGLPIAVVTGFEADSREDLPPRAADAGSFKKPIDLARLIETLRAYCGARGERRPTEAAAPRTEPRPERGYDVLVVEDDVDLGHTLASVLELEGYRARIAHDGREALALLGTGYRPSLLLVDLIMPIMDGWELCEALAGDTRYSTLPVILMSASGGPLPPPRRSKIVRLFKKPFTFSQLLDAVAKGCTHPPTASSAV
jgi:CheY-like chemotaxis protein